MSQDPLVVKQGQNEVLAVMGSQVTFLCRGDRTGNAWSLMECAAPREVGPPPHHHAWDEAYYVLAGEVRFSLPGREHILKAGDFIHIPAETLHGFTSASDAVSRVLI